jgi:hypothetical protein
MAKTIAAMDSVHTLWLDICYDDARDILKVFERMTKNKVTYEVMQAVGPGGGWPEIKVTGTKQAIIDSLPHYFAGYPDHSVDSFEFHAGLES